MAPPRLDAATARGRLAARHRRREHRHAELQDEWWRGEPGGEPCIHLLAAVDEQRDMVELMKTMVAKGDPDSAPDAHAGIALACLNGFGVPRSARARMLWHEQGEPPYPEHEALAWSRSCICGKGSLATEMWCIVQAHVGKSIALEHLPPELAPQ